MHTFNRFLVILICLTGVIFWCLVLLVVWFAPTELGTALGQIGRILRLQPVLLQVLTSGFGVSSVLVSLLILAGEFTARSAGSVRLASSQSADVSLETVGGHLRAALMPTPNVASLRPLVRRRGVSAIDVRLEVEPLAGSMLPALADQLAAATKHQVERELGLTLKNVTVQFSDAVATGSDADRRLPAIGDQAIRVPSAAASPTPPAQPDQP